MGVLIDFFSDTVTQPTRAMRQAMAEAEVGDEQRGEDPTTRSLEVRVAQILGLEAASFLPSATMANAIAIQLHCGPGDEDQKQHGAMADGQLQVHSHENATACF